MGEDQGSLHRLSHLFLMAQLLRAGLVCKFSLFVFIWIPEDGKVLRLSVLGEFEGSQGWEGVRDLRAGRVWGNWGVGGEWGSRGWRECGRIGLGGCVGS